MDAVEERIRAIVLGVTTEALRESGAHGLVLATPRGPEAELFLRWCSEAGIRVERPDEEVVRSVAEALEKGAPSRDEPGPRSAEACAAVARVRARTENLIPVATTNRTALLLSPVPSTQPFLPLGDVAASTVLGLTGGCTLPPGFSELAGDREILLAAERYMEKSGPRGAVESGRSRLDSGLRRRLDDALATGLWWRRVPPLVPKLGSRTWGIDLDL